MGWFRPPDLCYLAIYSIKRMPNQRIWFGDRVKSRLYFSASSLTMMPWLSTQGCIFSGKRQGASGYVHVSQISQDSVERAIHPVPWDYMNCSMAAVMFSCSLRVDSISSKLMTSETSAMVENRKHSL